MSKQKLKISEGNSKIGGVPNVSLTPGKSCVPGIACFSDGCYAKKSLMYPNVRIAWDSNLELYQRHPEIFFGDLEAWLRRNDPKLFRLFVGGDFPDESFWFMFSDMCQDIPGTQFLVFTKRYDYDYSQRPLNCQVILSTWPGITLPKNKDLPWAWIEKDCRIPSDSYYLRCPGDCSTNSCGHKCWKFVDKNVHVVFTKH